MSAPICPIMSHRSIHVECVGSRCALWQWQPRVKSGDPPHGYCGLVATGNPNWIPDPAHEEASG